MKTDQKKQQFPNLVPNLGFGLGLRAQHYPYIFEHKPAIDWFEIISENFMDTDGRPKRNLARIMEHYPIVMHGVSLSIGTVDPLNSEYLRKLKALIDWVKPVWISDHLCWTGIAHKNTHDLLPLPYTEEALRHIIQRIKEVQDFLERPIALENPSTYLEFKDSTMPEAEFIARMAAESGCHLLLDVNNVYVTCYNHRLDPKTYLDSLPLDHVVQMHLSGHNNQGSHIIDTHDDHVIDEVWNLYKYVIHQAGRTPNTMIEWDDQIPDFPVLHAELNKAKEAAKNATHYVLSDLFRPSIESTTHQNRDLQDAQIHMQRGIMQAETFDSAPDEWIRPKEDFPAASQLGVYINAYRYRLYDVVAEDYPVLKTALTQENQEKNKQGAFYELIWRFVNQIQPTHFNIGRFALKLPEFIKAHLTQERFSAPLFAHELCEFETIIAQMVDKQESAPLTPPHLEGLNEEQLMRTTLRPRAALALLAFHYPVNAYYQAVIDGESPPIPQKEKSFMAVFRHEDEVWRMDLVAEEYHLLQTLFSGSPVGEALEKANILAPQEVFTWFSRWMRNGMLAA